MKTPDKRISLFNSTTSDYIDNFRSKLTKLSIPSEEVNRILQKFIFNINSKPNDALLTPIFAAINETVDSESFNFMLEQIVYNLKGLFLDSHSLDRYLESIKTIYDNEINKLEALNLSLQKDLVKLEFLNNDIFGFTDPVVNDFSLEAVNDSFDFIKGTGLLLKSVGFKRFLFQDIKLNSSLTSKGDLDLNGLIYEDEEKDPIQTIATAKDTSFTYIVSSDSPIENGATFSIDLSFDSSKSFNFLKIVGSQTLKIKDIIINENFIDFSASSDSEAFDVYIEPQVSNKVTIVFSDNTPELSEKDKFSRSSSDIYFIKVDNKKLNHPRQLYNYIFSVEYIVAFNKTFTKNKLELDLESIEKNIGQIAIEGDVTVPEVSLPGIFNSTGPSANLEYNLFISRSTPKVDSFTLPILPLSTGIVENEVLNFTLVGNKVLAALRFRYHDVSYSPETYSANYTNIKVYRDGSLLKPDQDWNFVDLPALTSVVTTDAENNLYTKLGQTVIQLNIDSDSYNNKKYTCTYKPFHILNNNSTIHVAIVPSENNLSNIGFFDTNETYFTYERDTIISPENIIEFRNPLVNITKITPRFSMQNISSINNISPIIKSVTALSSTKDKLKYLTL